MICMVDDFVGRVKGHGLQMTDKVDIMFWVMKFELKKGRKPTILEVKAWWISQG